MDQELSAEALGVIAKVQKLLALAGNNPNENEAALASSKAMQLLEAYNLDMATVERNSGKTGKRSDTKMKGGLYKWQRELWEQVAKLHFCMYWSIKGLTKGSTYEQRILGRQENVIACKLMAEYLQQAVERLARERVGNDGSQFFTKASISFREGMAVRLSERLTRKRWEREEADRKKKAEDSRTYSTGTALVLADVRQSEQDANYDHLYGKPEGWHAEQRAKRDAANRAYAEEVARQGAIRQQWIADHPEEYAEQQAKAAREHAQWEAKEARKAARRKPTVYKEPKYKQYKGDYEAYGEGYRKGADIGLDQQINHNPTKRL